ncbi:MAG: glycosyltransferase [Candidatus Saganbacteria bacterium]|nr:glycosyltransferase [Candidatus Saganbacteria bacterium]
MLISACLIVKNEAEMLKKTLPNLIETLDEVIVVDTGSTDDTVSVVQALGAKVFSFSWCDDFSAARNESLKHAKGEWVLWIDADEYMEKEDLLKIKDLIANNKTADGFQFLIYECTPFNPSRQANSYYRTKVFKNFKGFHFERPINEQLMNVSNQNINGTHCELPIYHFGNKLTADKMKEKKQRNVRIFSEAVKEHPNDPHYRLHLADSYNTLEQFTKAVEEYSLAANWFDSIDLKTRALMGKSRCYYHLGKKEEALCVLEQILELNKNAADALNLKAIILLEAKQISQAIEILQGVTKLDIPLFSDSVMQVEQYTFLPHFLLGNAFLLCRKTPEAISAFETAQQAKPNAGLAQKLEKLKTNLK